MAELQRVLFIDDDELLGTLVSTTLAKDGIHVTYTNSGQEALTRLRDESFDLILLDMLMPDMNGLKTLINIRSEHEEHATPVITLSGANMNEWPQVKLDSKVIGHLQKPIEPAFLARNMKQIFQQKTSALALK